jgi:hypothetical protein
LWIKFQHKNFREKGDTNPGFEKKNHYGAKEMGIRNILQAIPIDL